MRIFSKTIVTLQSFRESIKSYYQRDQENWKRRVFVMYDETKNEVGKIDLSISLVKRRKDSFSSKVTNQAQTLVYQQNVPINPQNFPTYANQTASFSRTDKQVEKFVKDERPKTTGYENRKLFDETNAFDSQGFTNKATLKSFNVQEENNIAGPITSLQTIVGGYYCPPVMLLQKVMSSLVFIH